MHCLFFIYTRNITAFGALITISSHFTSTASITVAVTCIVVCSNVVTVYFEFHPLQSNLCNIKDNFWHCFIIVDQIDPNNN